MRRRDVTSGGMRAVVQRASRGEVRVDGQVVGSIGTGLVVLVGVTLTDSEADARALADKIAGLRIFPDEHGAMNLSVADVGGSVLVVSQFTLYADARKGRRPSFTSAAPPEMARRLIDVFVARLEDDGLVVATGEFGALMDVELTNHGPVTIILEAQHGRLV